MAESLDVDLILPKYGHVANAVGRVRADVPPIYLYRGWLVKSAAAFAIAKDTPKIAFAPSRDLLLVPSNSIIASSSST